MKKFIKDQVSGRSKLIIGLGLLMALTAALLFTPYCSKMLAAYREDAVLRQLIKSTGAELDSASVTGWVKVAEDAAGAGDPQVLASDAAARLDLTAAGRKVENWTNQYARGTKLEGRLPDGCGVSVLGQVMELPEGGKISHVMISATGAEKRKVALYKQKIHAALSRYGNEDHVAVTYSGRIKNGLNGEELLAGAERMMAEAGAPVQERTVKDNLVSLTGFSRRFSSDISYAGQEINLNVALRSNPEEHFTYVYAASPVIFIEY